MSKTILKTKKKVDYALLRKLEDAYEEAEDDLKTKEEILIKSVHKAYLDADNKGEFFEGLHKSESWYYSKFREYELEADSTSKSDALREVHAERKVDELISDFDDLAEEVPIVEVDESLKEGTDYVDPAEERKEWIEKTKEELMSKEPKAIIEDSNFGKYQETKRMLSQIKDISKYDFKVSAKYKPILIHQLEKAIEHLTKLKEELK